MTTPQQRIQKLFTHLVWLSTRPVTPELAQYQRGRLDGVKTSYALVTGLSLQAVEDSLAVARNRYGPRDR